MRAALEQAKKLGITHMAFGDLFLEDIREYRIKLLKNTGIAPLFPVWTTPEETTKLAYEMIDEGFQAVIACVDPGILATSYTGRTFNKKFLEELPEEIDRCAERGEFHTFCYGGPIFSQRIEISIGHAEMRSGYCFRDLILC